MPRRLLSLASDTVICEGSSITFTDQSSNNPTSWNWTFSGGSPGSSTAQNPTVTYNTAGTYTVTLVATNGNGNDTETKTSYITVLPSTPLPISEGFEGGVFPPSGWQVWNFDNATTWAQTSNAGGYGQSQRSAFVDNYNYNANGQQDALITPVMNFSGSINPKLWFDWAYAMYSNNFADSLGIFVSNDCGDTWNLEWFNGGNDLATAPATTSQFIPAPQQWNTDTIDLSAYLGQQAVQIAFVNFNGYGNTLLLDNINIASDTGGGPFPIADFIANTTAIPVGSTVNFTDLSTNVPTNWSWTFPGSTQGTSTQKNPVGIEYPVAGIYDVSLTASNANGADIETKANYITVYDTTSSGGCDTPFWYVVPLYYIHPADSSGFGFVFQDDDGNTPAIAGLNSNWMVFQEVLTPGDTNLFLGATSWFIPSGQADNWITFGSYTVPSGGATLFWYHQMPDNNFRDGYEVLINTNGGAVNNFNGAATLFSVADNDPATNGDTVWTMQSTTLDGATYGGQQVWIAFHHDANDQFFLFFDDFFIEACSTATLNPPVADFSADDVTPCVGQDVNFIDASTNNPTSWYWTFPGGTPSNSTAQNPMVTYNTPGVYTVTLIASNQDGSDTLVLVDYITVSSAPTVSTSFVQVSCKGGSDGAAIVSVSAGTGPYSYNWSNGGTTSTINGLNAGSYTVTVQDANGCQVSSTVNVTEPFTALVASSSSTNSKCGQANGAASVVASGGVNPYTYLWSNNDTSASISNVNAGNYTVSITDGNNCQIVESITVSDDPSTVFVNITKSDEYCGNANGSASVFGNGGLAPYSFNWSTGSTAGTIAGLSAGSYTVTVTDDEGCTASGSVSIQAQQYSFTINETITPAGCQQSNGAATVSATGGNGPYTYLWSTNDTTASITGLAAGSYMVTATDANGCASSSSVFVSNVGAASLTAQVEDASCNGFVDGSAVIQTSGGSGPFTYQFSGGSAIDSSVSGLASGSYTVTVTDGAGCISVAGFTVNEPAQISLSTSGTDEGCNQGNGSATAAATGGNGGFTYSWSNSSTGSSITGLSAGTYVVTATDANGCTSSSSVTIGNIPGPSSVITPTDASCESLSDGSANLTVSGGLAPFVYNWSNGSSSEDLMNVNAGSYSVTVTDANGCTHTNSVTISNSYTMSMSVSVNPPTNGTSNDGSATASASGGVGGYTYTWSNGQNGATANGLGYGTYSVTATDGNGCTLVQSVGVWPTGIVSTGDYGWVNLFPNPVVDQLIVEVEFSEERSVIIEMYDVIGNLLIQQDPIRIQDGMMSVDMSALPEGMYLLHMHVDQEEIVEAVIKTSN